MAFKTLYQMLLALIAIQIAVCYVVPASSAPGGPSVHSPARERPAQLATTEARSILWESVFNPRRTSNARRRGLLSSRNSSIVVLMAVVGSMMQLGQGIQKPTARRGHLLCWFNKFVIACQLVVSEF
ncbi:hypothetical protein DL98DRAFT_530479 [Cadophora sp. DSE1049]|nr:hypothetical protein DL98DRAFT_530479 [Cadophora sp. DSE1049]